MTAAGSGAAGPWTGEPRTNRRSAPPVECGSISQLPHRGRAVGHGYVESIRVVPATEAPFFAVIVTDPVPDRHRYGDDRPVRRASACRVRLIWLGQRKVPGIEAGTSLDFEGMVRPVDGIPTVYNPRYAIRPRQEDSK